MLYALAEAQAQLTFDRLHEGRPLRGAVHSYDPMRGRLRVTLRPGVAEALREALPAGTRLRYATAVRHESYVLDGALATWRGDSLELGDPGWAVLSDRRAAPRQAVGSRVHIEGRDFQVLDVSSRGLAVADPEGHLPAEGRVRYGLPGGPESTALVCYSSDGRVGLMCLGDAQAWPPPLQEARLEHLPALIEAQRVTPAERVEFGRLVGLWSEAGEGPRMAIVVAPAFAKTKECTALLAQMLCASFAASGRAVSVLRIDFSNALGESHRDRAHWRAGHETVGLLPSACVEDLRCAVDYALERSGALDCALIGASFSGPLCLRAAVTHPGVTALAQLMGGSDLQDLIRAATGGVDYIARARAGLGGELESLLGVLSDTRRWAGDALEHELAGLADAQLDASRLRVPLLWVQGDYDAFVNARRVRALLGAASGPRKLVTVPTGHVPSRSAEARLSYAPVIRFLLAQLGAEARLAAPDEASCARQEALEWSRAPRARLASPADYWRDYMLGEGGGLGFEVLAMTREYRAFMAAQTDLLQGPVVHDLGGGLGHALPHLAAGGVGEVHLYDLVAELLPRARARGRDLGLRVHTEVWDASEGVPELGEAREVLLSLFLSVLQQPLDFLRALYAALPIGATVVASSICPDADLSKVYAGLMADVEAGAIAPPEGWDRARLREAVRAYMNSAAWLLRLTEEGTFTLYDASGLAGLLRAAGFEIRSATPAFGAPPRAVIVHAIKS